jgi:hypothetical protein
VHLTWVQISRWFPKCIALFNSVSKFSTFAIKQVRLKEFTPLKCTNVILFPHYARNRKDRSFTVNNESSSRIDSRSTDRVRFPGLTTLFTLWRQLFLILTITLYDKLRSLVRMNTVLNTWLSEIGFVTTMYTLARFPGIPLPNSVTTSSWQWQSLLVYVPLTLWTWWKRLKRRICIDAQEYRTESECIPLSTKQRQSRVIRKLRKCGGVLIFSLK